MIKKFIDLAKVDLPITKKPIFKWNKAKQKLEQDGELDTISWADCLQALYDNGAEKVLFDNVQNKDGGLLFKDENDTFHILVYVDIDGDRRQLFYPLIDGTKNVKIAEMTQLDIYNAKQRAFVKCVAINFGLGINFWKKDKEPEIKAEEITFSEEFRNIVNSAVKHCGGVNEMLKHLNGISEKRIKELVADAVEIDGIAKELNKVIENDKK